MRCFFLAFAVPVHRSRWKNATNERERGKKTINVTNKPAWKTDCRLKPFQCLPFSFGWRIYRCKLNLSLYAHNERPHANIAAISDLIAYELQASDSKKTHTDFLILCGVFVVLFSVSHLHSSTLLRWLGYKSMEKISCTRFMSYTYIFFIPVFVPLDLRGDSEWEKNQPRQAWREIERQRSRGKEWYIGEFNLSPISRERDWLNSMWVLRRLLLISSHRNSVAVTAAVMIMETALLLCMSLLLCKTQSTMSNENTTHNAIVLKYSTSPHPGHVWIEGIE